jgi:hypothetical protein
MICIALTGNATVCLEQQSGYIIQHGQTASQYDAGIMPTVVQYRLEAGEVAPIGVDGYVAYHECQHIGALVFLRFDETGYRPYMIADCGSPEANQWMKGGGIVVEVDHQTAKRHGFVGRGASVDAIIVEPGWKE